MVLLCNSLCFILVGFLLVVDLFVVFFYFFSPSFLKFCFGICWESVYIIAVHSAAFILYTVATTKQIEAARET